MRLNLPPLGSVGVNVDQRVERDVELVGKFPKILRLGTPVDSPGGDVLPRRIMPGCLSKTLKTSGSSFWLTTTSKTPRCLRLSSARWND